ncbi:formyltransferase family protein [Thermomicrobium roseum]|uniref:formyltransferase family protein n=1 Tax=Thermomicrobium roseum TaxID=500 RepID=UPI0006897E6F|nr:formyltransferase family protein [Thermomicrobium roseum]
MTLFLSPVGLERLPKRSGQLPMKSKPVSKWELTLWGNHSRQTTITLQVLLLARVPVRCLVLAGQIRQPGTNRRIPLAVWNEDVAVIAARHAIPVVHVPARSTLFELCGDERISADLGVISCFPWKIDARLVRLYPFGMINIHPSLLPDFRGPSPLFWQYHDGRLRGGITLHWVTDELDGGPIIDQVTCDIPLGFPGDRLEAWLAWYGTSRLVEILGRNKLPAGWFPTRLGSWAPVPDDAACLLDTSWPAWRAAHFLNGVLPLGYPVSIRDHEGRVWIVRRCLGWSSRPTLSAETVESLLTLSLQGGTLTVLAEHRSITGA